MKNIAFILLVIIAISYGCQKDDHYLVSTTLKGQVRTNGTEDPIKLSVELDKPIVTIYGEVKDNDPDIVIGGGIDHEEIISMEIDENGEYFITVDLYNDVDYCFGVSNVDESLYYESTGTVPIFLNQKLKIEPGKSNHINYYKSAKSWVKFRVINSNTNIPNQDIFNVWGLSFIGLVDTSLNTISETWSGYEEFGSYGGYNQSHYVHANLSRNGMSKDTIIQYFVPPFDTTVIDIWY